MLPTVPPGSWWSHGESNPDVLNAIQVSSRWTIAPCVNCTGGAAGNRTRKAALQGRCDPSFTTVPMPAPMPVGAALIATTPSATPYTPSRQQAWALDLVGGIEPPISWVAASRLTHLATPGLLAGEPGLAPELTDLESAVLLLTLLPHGDPGRDRTHTVGVRSAASFRWNTGPGDESRSRTRLGLFRKEEPIPLSHLARCRSFPAVRAHWYSGEDLHLHALSSTAA